MSRPARKLADDLAPAPPAEPALVLRFAQDDDPEVRARLVDLVVGLLDELEKEVG
jgi:hypothetical protein